MLAAARHHSWQEYFRRPFGAGATGSEVRLRLEVLGEGETRCFLHLRDRAGQEQLLPMALIDQIGEQGMFHRLYERSITLPAQPGLLWYDFEIEHDELYYYYGCMEGSGGEGRLSTVPLSGFQITVYHPSAVPAWFQNGLVYQIFPDRFYGSLPPGQHRPAGSRRLLHTDWEDVPFYNRDADGAIARWDFFGGDLPGIVEKLPYLEALGVDAVYLNPIFQAASNHRYDTGDYHRIDPLLGDENDLRQLCKEAEKRGIRIILDGVFAHSGDDSVYFNRWGRYPSLGACQSKESPYYKWYHFEEWPERYQCWWGVKALPRFDCEQDSYRDFIYRRPDSVLRHWMECGISGWRLDVADELPDSFIAEFKSALRQADPEAVLIGEVWEDASHKVSYGELRRYLDGYELDAATNYPLREALLDYLLGKCTPQTAWRCMMQLYENYPATNFQAALNLIGSHDRPRILTLLGEAPPEDSLNEFERERFRLTPAAEELGKKRLQLLLMMQLLLPGNACVYYGDEAGMQGYSDPYNRGPFPWGSPDEELRIAYHRLIGLRKQFRELLSGEFIPLYDDGDVLGFRLRREEEELLVCINRSPEARTLECLHRPESVGGAGAEEEMCWHIEGGLGFARPPLRMVDLLDEPEPDMGADDDCLAAIHLRPLSGKVYYIRYQASAEPNDIPQNEETAKVSNIPQPRERIAGILMHLTSLPSQWGSGTMGSEAYGFVDFLAAAGQRLWQVLPLNPVGGGNSPYQSHSLRAGNPYLISPDKLHEEGLLSADELAAWRERARSLPAQRVDHAAWAALCDDGLRQAYAHFARGHALREEFELFGLRQAEWLDDYALYKALQEHLGEPSWQRWPEELARRDEAALSAWREQLKEHIEHHRFIQFIFFRQWRQLKAYANAQGIALIGDLPIYAAADSCDTWVQPHLFRLDDHGYPAWLAGVPPDYFCAEGQLWENPVYEWRAMEADGFSWWLRRIRHSLEDFDHLRLDHFRGFEAGWMVERGQENAMRGQWRRGPGHRLFRALERELGALPFIAENLGFITRDVESMRECFGLPGMKILQFCPLDEEGRPRLTAAEAHNVFYSGTHDNETLLGWLRRCDEALSEEEAIARGDDLLEKMFAVPCPWVILPLQDVLLLDNAARMNIPGTAAGNWEWRALPEMLSPEVSARLYARTARAQRRGAVTTEN